ncbi:MAG TPA: hypothetical protein VNZ86_05760, partial [Bacteroidia bacterium]|nr:hypothetical protein [Bacteroidia bacterium]
MFNSQFIEVGIGIVFIFLLLSILVSGINELISSFYSHRGKQLQEAISSALTDPLNKDWASKLYNHPLINTLKKSEKALPAYISSDNFSKALIDVLIRESDSNSSVNVNMTRSTDPVQDFINGLNTLRESDTKSLLASFASTSEGKYDVLKTNIENWYNEYMNRVSGWYKKKNKKLLLLTGFIAAVLINADTIHISQQLWENSVLRTSLVNAAVSYASANDSLPMHPVNQQAGTAGAGTRDSARAEPENKSFPARVQNIRKGY